MFGQRLFKLRRNEGLTQKELGEELGVSALVINQWENGLKQASYERIIQVANSFDVTLDYLFGRTNSPNLPKAIERYKELNDTEKSTVFLDIIRIAKRKDMSLEELVGIFYRLENDEDEE